MRTAAAIAIFVFVIVVLATVWAKQHQAIYAVPLVKAAGPICPHFEAHPCSRMNCSRRIA